MTENQALIAAVCVLPLVTTLVCIFACELRIQHREADTRRFPRPGTHPERPKGFKPFRKHPDMLTKVDDE